jgi:hypothetical protein
LFLSLAPNVKNPTVITGIAAAGAIPAEALLQAAVDTMEAAVAVMAGVAINEQLFFRYTP